MEQIINSEYDLKLETLRKTEFPHLREQLYLDNAGSALYCNLHLQKYFEDLQRNLYCNPHSGNPGSAQMSNIIDEARSTVASYFNVSTDDYDVIFTSGATASLRLLGECFAWKPGSHFVYLDDNHTSVVGVRELAAAKGAIVHSLGMRQVSASGQRRIELSDHIVKHVKGSAAGVDTGIVCGDRPCLFAFPAQSNFSGVKYPLKWIKDFQTCDNAVELAIGLTHGDTLKRNWYVLCDAASYVSTSFLDLKNNPADFVPISFYKIFGFPTGLGALLVKKGRAIDFCQKTYFGGGSVTSWLSTKDYFHPKPILHERLEDGTSCFLGILAVMHGFDTLKQLGLSIKSIQSHTFSLLLKCSDDMLSLKHYNGSRVVEIYGGSGRLKSENHGPIIAFNVLRPNGNYIGYNHVLELASNQGFHLRGGCFCNVGACSSLLGVSEEVLLQSYKDGHVCGDKIDLIAGKPIGASRISFGYCSVISDVVKLISFLSNCFQEKSDEIFDEVFYDARSDVTEEKPDVKLDKIIIYPVKSCNGFEVPAWKVSPTGLLYDRIWMIMRQHSICVTLKKEPRLILISPQLDIKANLLKLSAPGVDAIEIPIVDSKAECHSDISSFHTCTAKVCGDKVDVLDCGEEASSWLTKVLGYPCRLWQKCFENERFMKGKPPNNHYSGTVSLANEAQYLMINRESVKYLLRQIPHDDGASKHNVNEALDCLTKRFRSNFVISGAPPFAEDCWTSVTINPTTTGSEKVRFSVCGLCNRCRMICVNPVSGEKASEPLKTLARLKTPENLKRKPTFGVYLTCETPTGSVAINSAIDFA